MACGILVPRPEIHPCPLHWKHGVLATGPPGKSLSILYIYHFSPTYLLSVNVQCPLSLYHFSPSSHLFLSIQGIERESWGHPHHCCLGEPSPDALFSLSLLSSYLDSAVWRKDCKRGLKSESEVAQSCPTLWDPTDCSPPGSSVCGVLQARILEWAAISFSRGSSQPGDQT